MFVLILPSGNVGGLFTLYKQLVNATIGKLLR